MKDFTNKEKAEEAEREAKMRRRVYPRQNNYEPLTTRQERQIAIMDAIAEDYLRLAREEENDMFIDDG